MFLLGNMFLFKNKKGACSGAIGYSNKTCFFIGTIEESAFLASSKRFI